MPAGGTGGASIPADRLSAGLTATVDRVTALPDHQRAFLSLEANRTGPELAAGYRLWTNGWSQGALVGWAGSEWSDLRDWTYGVRAEARF